MFGMYQSPQIRLRRKDVKSNQNARMRFDEDRTHCVLDEYKITRKKNSNEVEFSFGTERPDSEGKQLSVSPRYW